MKCENDVDPITQEPLKELVYPAFTLTQDGKCFGFDPVSLANYILREGKAINLFTRQPLSQQQLKELQALLDQLHKDGLIKSSPNLLTFMEKESTEVRNMNEELNHVEFALENMCLDGIRRAVVCCKFYDEDLANSYLSKNVLPDFKDAFSNLLKINPDSAQLMLKRCLQSVMEPYRKNVNKEPSLPLATTIAFVKRLQLRLYPVFGVFRNV